MRRIHTTAALMAVSLCTALLSCHRNSTSQLQTADVPVKALVNIVGDYKESFPAQVSVLQLGGKTRLGPIHALMQMGIPFFVSPDLDSALRHRLIVLQSDTAGLSDQAVQRLQQHVTGGGSIIAFNASSDALKPLFGVKQCTRSRARHHITFKPGADSIEAYLNRPEELEVPLGSTKINEVIWTTGCTAASANVLATFEDGSAAVLRRTAGAGTIYFVGVDLRDVVIRNQSNHDFEAERLYVNGFEPGTDVWLLLLRAWYEHAEPDAVRLATISNGQRSALLLSHDIDWSGSYHLALAYAAMEEKHGTRSTFFAQTKYVSDSYSAAYFFGPVLNDLRQLYSRGFSIGSHTVIHSPNFNGFALGTGEESYPTYQPTDTDPSVKTEATVFGEVRVSKQLLDGEMPGHVTDFFRAGHLRVPSALPQALQRCGYLFDSSFTAGDVLTNFPYALPLDLGFDEDSGIYEFPVTIEDERKPPLKERVERALEVIRANAENGAVSVVLIHTNESQEKLPAEEDLLRKLPKDILVTDMANFARFWRARDRLHWTVEPGREGHAILNVNTDADVAGLTFEFRREINRVDGARLLEDHHRIVLPDTRAGQPVAISLVFN